LTRRRPPSDLARTPRAPSPSPAQGASDALDADSAGAPSDPQRRFYTQALTDGLNEAQQVGWESVALQRLRFEALLEAVDPDDLRRPTTRLLDVGCGMGALYAHLRATGRPVEYLGIDLCPEMIDAARARHGQDPRARFLCADALRWTPDEPFDVVVCCGGLSLRFDPRARANWRLIDKLTSLARWCASFNLQAAQPGEGDIDRRFWLVNPSTAWRALSRRCARSSLRQDVIPGELVAYLYPSDYTRTLRSPAWLATATPEDTAEALLQQDLFGPAADLLTSLPKLNPRAATLLGIAFSHLDDPESAISLLSQALALRPADLTCAENLLRLLLDANPPDLPRVEQLLRKTLSAAAGAPAAARDALRSLAHQALRALHEPAAHLSAVSLTAGAETPAVAALMRARDAATARAPSAPDLYAAAAALQPWDTGLLIERATLLLSYDRPQDALPLALDALQADRRDPTALALLQQLHTHLASPHASPTPTPSAALGGGAKDGAQAP
jgi:SAM-dependent methyltransferase